MVEGQGQLSPQVAVLGALLISPELVGQAAERVRDEDFTTPRCRMVWQAIRAQYAEDKPVDPVTVRERLGGGPEDNWGQYLLELMDLTPTASNVWEYVTLLREEAVRHRAAELGGMIQANPERLGEYLAQLEELTVDRRGAERMDMSQMLLAFADRHSGAPHQYMTWGIPKLDRGLYAEPGDMIVLGGYPSAGKTALAVAMAYHQAGDRRVGFYSLETNRYKLADRLIANLVGIDLGAIKRGQISEEEWTRMAEQSDRIRARQLELVEASGMSAQDIRADALAHRYEVVYIDYLQLVEPETRRANRTEQVSGISRSLQQFAHGSGRMVVPLSQLARPERAGDDEMVEPTMSALRESGQIEQDADAVLLLYLEEPSTPDKSRRVLKIAKNKEGTRGRIYLVFDGEFQRFRESALDEPVRKESKPRSRKGNRSTGEQMTWEELDNSEPIPF